MSEQISSLPVIAPRAPRWAGVGFFLLTRAAQAVNALWWQRGNGSQVVPSLLSEDGTVIRSDGHNSFVDTIAWRGEYFLVHVSSPWHLSSDKARIVAYRSADARNWRRWREFHIPGEDIRDPKFAVIGDRLFLYVLKNNGFAAKPYSTAYAVCDDGASWSRLRDCQPPGWLFWRPKTFDGKTWYVTAYWHEHGRSALFRSTDGENWREVSTIYEGECNDETDFEFFADGRILATARLEVTDNLLGHKDGSTLIALAEPPYTNWQRRKCQVTRLDGPNLFRHGDTIFAVGRRHENAHRFPFHFGSVLGRKRTALFRVAPEGLTHLSDLPSGGDTSYAGVLKHEDDLVICYYTNPIDRDYPWLLGMMLPTEVRSARIPLARLAGL